MHPVLFKFKGLTIHTYGVLVALGFLIGITYSIRKGKKEGIESDKIFDLAFYLILSAIIGSRALYVLMNFKDYSKEPLRMLMIWEGGLVFYGGLILAVIVGFSYMKIKKMEFWKTTDVMAPGIALGHAIGRLGCFNAGCCYGKPSHVAWAVTFRDPQSLAPKGIPLHPVQLYSSFTLFIIFIILIVIGKVKKFHGEVFWSYVLLYAIARFILEHFRGDPRGELFNGLISITQGIAILTLILAFFMMLILSRRHKLKGNIYRLKKP